MTLKGFKGFLKLSLSFPLSHSRYSVDNYIYSVCDIVHNRMTLKRFKGFLKLSFPFPLSHSIYRVDNYIYSICDMSLIQK